MTNQDQDQNQETNGATEARRVSEAVGRLYDVLSTEFPDLRPPQMIFVLHWLSHTIFLEIDEITGNRPARRQQHQQPEPEVHPDLFKN